MEGGCGCRTNSDGSGCGVSDSSRSALLCPDILTVAQDDVCEGSYVDVRNPQEVYFRVRHVDMRILNI